MTTNVQPSPSGMFSRDDHSKTALALHLQATTLKGAGDLAGAILKLQEAKAFMEKCSVCFPDSMWDRLARCLQQAGRYAEAMAEFDYLLSDLERRGKHSLEFDDPSVKFTQPKGKLLAQFVESHRPLIWRTRREVQIREIKRLRKLGKAKARTRV